MTFKGKAIKLPLFIAVGTLVAGTLLSKAEDSKGTSNASSGTPPAASSVPSAGASSTAAPLQGNVEKVHLSLDKLREVGLDLKHLLKTSSSLYDEVTIQPMRMVTEPDYIGNGIVINIPISTQPIGPAQPPNPARVGMAMDAIRPVVSLLKTNVDEFMDGHKELDLPQDIQTELKPEFDQWVTSVNDLAANEQKLEQLTKGPQYDNQAIATETTAMQKDIKTLEEMRHKIYKVIRKEGKRIAGG